MSPFSALRAWKNGEHVALCPTAHRSFILQYISMVDTLICAMPPFMPFGLLFTRINRIGLCMPAQFRIPEVLVTYERPSCKLFCPFVVPMSVSLHSAQNEETMESTVYKVQYGTVHWKPHFQRVPHTGPS